MFALGTNYPKRWAQLISTPSGKPQVMEMGCYGIGVTRVVGRRDRAEPRRARHHLARTRMAPFAVAIAPIGMRPQRGECKAAADKLHDELAGGRRRSAARRPRRASWRDVC